MTSPVHRRAFLAATTLAVPAIALAGVSANANMTTNIAEPMEFGKLMKQANRHLKSMRTPMRSLDTDASWDAAAFLANQITILLAQCIEVADQVHIPPQSEAKYADNKSAFTTDLRLAVSTAAITSINLSQALWSKDEQAAKSAYSKIRMIRNDGHGEFQDDD